MTNDLPPPRARRSRLRHALTFVPAALILFIGACVRDDQGEVDTSGKSGKLTMAEARKTFERHFAAYAQTRSHPEKRDFLVSFDYSPLWNQGNVKHSDYGSTMTVPMQTDRVLYMVYLDPETQKPSKSARISQEVQIVKNFARGFAYPVIKTVMPLDGRYLRPGMDASQTSDYLATRNEVVYYQTLDGKKIAVQLFENGVETVHAFIGEDPKSYAEKLTKVFVALRGYVYAVGRASAITTRANPRYCTDCGLTYEGAHHDCLVCPWCGGSLGLGGTGHTQYTFCFACNDFFCRGDTKHLCPPYVCETCYVVAYGNPGNHPCEQRHCNTCGADYYGEIYLHTCERWSCAVCFQEYLGPVYSHQCAGPFCPICQTAPCTNSCPDCSPWHCNGHNPPPVTPSQIAPQATQFFSPNANLTLTQWEKLEEWINEFQKDCLTNYMLNTYLRNRNLSISIGPPPDPREMGKYLDDTIALYNFGDTINGFYTLWHEMFHAADDRFTPGGILDHDEPGGANMEYQAYFAEDLFRLRRSGDKRTINRRILGKNEELNRAYAKDIFTLINNRHAFNILDYIYPKYLVPFANQYGCTDYISPDITRFEFLNEIVENSGCF